MPALSIMNDAYDVRADQSGRYDVNVSQHKASYQEVVSIMSSIGVHDNGANYNILIDGHGTGLTPPTYDQWMGQVDSLNIVEDISLDGDGPAPSSIDHSSSQYFPPIGNQASEGSCVPWAVGYYVKTFQEAKEHGWDLSGASWIGGYTGQPGPGYQSMIFSPDFIYHQINNGLDHGSAYIDAMDLISNIGVSSWESMPYDPDDSVTWPSEAAWREAPLYRGDIYGFNYMDFGPDVDDLKNLLLSGNMGVISINAYLYGNLTASDLWTTDNYNPVDTNHANTVVGFDDDFGYMENGELRHGAFKIANSWGTGWPGDHNEDGFYWISYEAMRTKVDYFMFFGDIVGYEPKTVAVFDITHDARYECDITFGTGETSDPTMTKPFSPYYLSGGAQPFPANKIVFDITELIPESGVDIFIDIYDNIGMKGSSLTGTLNSFSIEQYGTYNIEGNADMTFVSDDVPLPTINDTSVYAICQYLPSLMQPLLSFPNDTNDMGIVCPTFTWGEVPNSIGYQLEIATDPSLLEDGSFVAENIVFTTDISGPSANAFCRPEYAFELSTYYWHVRGKGINEEYGPWSDVWSSNIVEGTSLLFSPGWTLASFPYLPSSVDLDTFLSGLEGKIDYVYRWNPSIEAYEYSFYFEGYGWEGDFNTIDGEYGYWFHSTDTGICSIFENDGVPSATSIDIYEGWNLVSWPRKESSEIGLALGDIGPNIDYVYRWNPFLEVYEYSFYFEGYGWEGDFNTFDPGYGYWLHSASECVWVLP